MDDRKSLEMALANGHISRRRFMQLASAAGLAASTSLILPGSAVAAPKKGGKFRLAMAHGNTVDNYDPATWTNAYDQVFTHSRNSYLTEVANDGTLVGELAESWDASDDATTWTFKLRQGIEYHNGKTMTPEDVIASISHHRSEDSKSAAKPILKSIKEIKADGNNVVFILDAGNADFPFVLSDYHLPILPSADGKIEVGAIGCGGYIVEAFEPGVRANLKRNPNYWKEGRAWFDEIEILSIVDAAARQNALVTGEVDAIDQVDLNTVKLLKRQRNLEILAVTGTQHYTFAMDTRAEPYKDNNVRLALKHAIDREELVAKILNGYGSVGNDHPISPANRYYASDLEQRTYDPEKAKHYLKKAGLDSLEVALSAADAAFGGAVDAAVLYAEKAAAAGIKIKVVREPNDGYWSNVWMKKPWSAVYWGGRPTEDWMFSTAYESGAAWNDSFWENEKFNVLLKEARSELDDPKRRQMYGEMQQIVRDDGGVVIPMFAAYVMAHSKKIAHDENVGSNWTMDGFRAPERWWFS